MNYQPLSEVSVAGFDKAMKEFTKEVAEHGWLGRRTKQGHIIARAPDGETTMCITRSELRGRSDKNVRADFNRWLKQQEEQVEVPTPAEVFKPEPEQAEQVPPPWEGTMEDGSPLTPEAEEAYERYAERVLEEVSEEAAEPEPEGFMCPHPGCGRVFARRRSLQGHKRKHTLKYEDCPLCGRSVTYMGKHLRSSHNATVEDPEAFLADRRPDPVDALEEIIEEVDRLRADNEELRTQRDDARARLELLREALNA